MLPMILGVFTLLLTATACQAQDGFIYALGTNPGSEARRLYSVDASTLSARSVEVGGSGTGMLNGKRNLVVLSDGQENVLSFRTADLNPANQMTIDLGGHPGYPACLKHTFVHPITGLVYFSCEFGNSPDSVLVVDLSRESIIANLHVGAAESDFAYDPGRKWLYVIGPEIAILDSADRLVGKISPRDLARDVGFRYPWTYSGPERRGSSERQSCRARARRGFSAEV